MTSPEYTLTDCPIFWDHLTIKKVDFHEQNMVLISSKVIDVCFAGIGENGHLAFNDPPANFETDSPYIRVELDPLPQALYSSASKMETAPQETVCKIMIIEKIFGTDLGINDILISRITYWLENLQNFGTIKTVEIAINKDRIVT